MTWIHRACLALGLTAMLIAVPTQWAGLSEPGELTRVRGERDDLDAGNEALERQIRALEAEVDALRQTDLLADESASRAVERVAREDLNLVRPEDVVFELVDRGVTP